MIIIDLAAMVHEERLSQAEHARLVRAAIGGQSRCHHTIWESSKALIGRNLNMVNPARPTVGDLASQPVRHQEKVRFEAEDGKNRGKPSAVRR